MAKKSKNPPVTGANTVKEPTDTATDAVVTDSINSTPDVVNDGREDDASEVTKDPVVEDVVVEEVLSSVTTPVTANDLIADPLPADADTTSVEVVTAEPAVEFSLSSVEEDLKAEEVVEDHPFIMIVKQYAIDMHPAKPQTPVSLSRYQQNFYAMLTGLINRSEYGDFAKPFSEFLKIVADDTTGVFDERHFQRGRENLNISRDDRRAMQRIFAMVSLVAKFETRAEIVRNSNMEYFIEFGLSERGRNNIRQFLNIN